jgi:hypothetical protein
VGCRHVPADRLGQAGEQTDLKGHLEQVDAWRRYSPLETSLGGTGHSLQEYLLDQSYWVARVSLTCSPPVC